MQHTHVCLDCKMCILCLVFCHSGIPSMVEQLLRSLCDIKQVTKAGACILVTLSKMKQKVLVCMVVTCVVQLHVACGAVAVSICWVVRS